MRSKSTADSVTKAARKILKSKTATKAEKAVAASALTQKPLHGAASQNGAAAILKSKTASKEAKASAASALTQRRR